MHFNENYFLYKLKKRMKKIYIAGAGGMLGEAFYAKFKDDYQLKCTDIDLNDDWLDFLDFRKLREYFEDVNKFNLIFVSYWCSQLRIL